MTGKHNTDENGYAYTESRQHILHNGQFYVKRLIYKSCPFARQKDTFRHAKAGILKHERTHTAMRQYSSLKIKKLINGDLKSTEQNAAADVRA